MLQSFAASVDILEDNVSDGIILLRKGKSFDIECHGWEGLSADFFLLLLLLNNILSCLVPVGRVLDGDATSFKRLTETVTFE